MLHTSPALLLQISRWTSTRSVFLFVRKHPAKLKFRYYNALTIIPSNSDLIALSAGRKVPYVQLHEFTTLYWSAQPIAVLAHFLFGSVLLFFLVLHWSYFRLSLALLNVCLPLFFHFWFPPGVRVTWISLTLRILQFKESHVVQLQEFLNGKDALSTNFFSYLNPVYKFSFLLFRDWRTSNMLQVESIPSNFKSRWWFICSNSASQPSSKPRKGSSLFYSMVLLLYNYRWTLGSGGPYMQLIHKNFYWQVTTRTTTARLQYHCMWIEKDDGLTCSSWVFGQITAHQPRSASVHALSTYLSSTQMQAQ